MDKEGTHFPILAACVARTQGPVLELGCGEYSTPMLHFLCNGRRLVSLEDDPDWINKYKELETNWHTLQFVDKWADARIIDEVKWDVAFVDHAPAEQRIQEIKRLKNLAKHIVIHDTENPNGIYKYDSILPEFKFRFDFKKWSTWTSVVSMFEEFIP